MGTEPKVDRVLNELISNIMDRKKLTSQMIRKMIVDYGITPKRASLLIDRIEGKCKLTYNNFKFIMYEILQEARLNDPRLKHFETLGKGEDLLSRTFGRLTVIECMGKMNGRTTISWKCRCSNPDNDGKERCGKETIVTSSNLNSGNVLSCGCYHKEVTSKRSTIHGKTRTAEYYIWMDITMRCTNADHISFFNYGGRGITICERWKKFENFYKDMGNKPEGLHLHLKNRNASYCKENCEWAAAEKQHCNRLNTLRFEDGTPVGRWAKENNLNYRQVIYRFHLGYTQPWIFSYLSGAFI